MTTSPLVFLLLLGLSSNFVDLIQSVHALALAQLCTLLVTVHLASVLAVARSSKTEAKARLQNFDVQYV